MSVHGMREALLAREAHALLLRQALTGLNAAPSSPPPRLLAPRPPAMIKPSHTHLTLQLDCSRSQTWWCLQESPPVPFQGGGSHNTPTPAQLSYILLKLREEIPAFFTGHHSYDLYDPHMIFENQLWRYPWEGRGLLSYRLFLRGSRLALGCVASGLRVDLLRITKDPEEGRVDARWRIRGRHHWSTKQRVLLDGLSSFTVSTNGLISSHRLSRLEPPKKHTLLHRINTWLALHRKLPQPEL